MHRWIHLLIMAVTSIISSPPSTIAASFHLIGTKSIGSAHFLFDLDVGSGLASNQRNIAFSHSFSRMAGIAIDPVSGDLIGLTTTPWSRLLRINPQDGTVDIDQPAGLASIFEGDLSFHPITGELYGINKSSSDGPQLFKLDVQTGNPTIVGAVASSGDYSALSFDNTGMLYAINTAGTENSSLERIDIVSGAVAQTIELNVNLGATAAMTFHPISGLPFVVDGGTSGTNSLYGLDIEAGILSLIGSTGIESGLSGLTFIPVPEPSSEVIVLLASTIILMRSRPDWLMN